MFNKTKSLIVVYKDEMLVNQLKKLVETKDDISDDEIVGTRDNSVKIVPWTEKVWLDNTNRKSPFQVILRSCKRTEKIRNFTVTFTRESCYIRHIISFVRLFCHQKSRFRPLCRYFLQVLLPCNLRSCPLRAHPSRKDP